MRPIKGGRAMIREVKRDATPGIPVLLVLLAVELACIAGLIASAVRAFAPGILAAIVLIVATAVLLCGVFTVSPNQGRVLQLFGAYRGTAREPGLRWANPFYSKRAVS